VIHVACLQGSEEWQDARLGIPTASQFHRILTPKTLKPSKQARGYLHELLAERLLGEPLDAASGGFMERGIILESEAAGWYALQSGKAVTECGFCLLDDRSAGASPDRLVGDDGLLEIKCYAPAHHVAALLGDADDAHRLQIQGQLLVTGRAWCDLLFYHPSMPPKVVRHEADYELWQKLDNALRVFCAELALAWERLEAR